MANTLRSEFPVYRLHALVNYKYINSILAAPSVSLPSVVETLPGHEVTFSVNGTLPLNTTVMKNSTVLFTGVESAAALIFHEEGKFTCMARNSFGSYFKEFSVIFGGMIGSANTVYLLLLLAPQEDSETKIAALSNFS